MKYKKKVILTSAMLKIGNIFPIFCPDKTTSIILICRLALSEDSIISLFVASLSGLMYIFFFFFFWGGGGDWGAYTFKLFRQPGCYVLGGFICLSVCMCS